MDFLGKNPISGPVLLLGKVSMLFCWLFFFAGLIELPVLFENSVARIAAIVLVAAGLACTVTSVRQLGESASVGLSRDATLLKTRGMYAVTRNPMYVGGYLVSLGSCLYSPHPVNFALCALTIAIHHAIVLKEEKFLADRFGVAWLAYRGSVPRYVGRVKPQAMRPSAS